jgi:hypothetical protein
MIFTWRSKKASNLFAGLFSFIVYGMPLYDDGESPATLTMFLTRMRFS